MDRQLERQPPAFHLDQDRRRNLELLADYLAKLDQATPETGKANQ
jgi:hypothetical protein